MEEKKTSVIYPIISISSILVFVLAILGFFLPVVGLEGQEAYSIARFFTEAIDSFKALSGSNPNQWAVTFNLIFRNLFIAFLMVGLLIKFIWRFVKYLLKNRKVFAKSFNDFYGEDLLRISLSIATYIAVLFAYFGSNWSFGIGLILSFVAAVLGLVEFIVLRLFESFKSEEKKKAVPHNILMIVIGLMLFVTIIISLQRFFVDDSGNGVPLLDNFTNFLFAVFKNVRNDTMDAFFLELLGILLILLTFGYLEKGCLCAFDAVPRSRKQRREHVKKEAHIRGIVYSSIALGFLVVGTILAIVKYEDAYGTTVSIGATAIVSMVLLAASIALFAVCKKIRPVGKMKSEMSNEELAALEGSSAPEIEQKAE